PRSPRLSFFFLPRSAVHLALLSFPTRRSSDLRAAASPASALTFPYASCPTGGPSCTTSSRFGSLAACEAALTVTRAAGSPPTNLDRKSTRLNSSHVAISYAVFCLKKKNPQNVA